MSARLAKVEALARAAGTEGERVAAEAAARRLRASQVDRSVADHEDIDMLFVLNHPWAGRLLTALCHRYAIEPAGIAADGRMIVRAPRVFLEGVLAPEFERVRSGLAGIMGDLTTNGMSCVSDHMFETSDAVSDLRSDTIS